MLLVVWQSYAGSFSTGIQVENRDLIVFAFMGIVGGIMGATFNNCHKVSSSSRPSEPRVIKGGHPL